MRFSQVFNCVKHLGPQISVLFRGPMGIGKSQTVYQLGEYHGLEVVERRLSQMSEGDIVGLPFREGDTTRFLPTDWFMDCVKNPRLLFLDEINRATPEIMQAAFQIVLDRTLNGYTLHPGTRVFAAVNASSEYQVNEMDPALLDRFWVVDIEPTLEDFVAYHRAKNTVHPDIIDFVQHNENFLFPKIANSLDKIGTPRSFERLSKTLTDANLVQDYQNPLLFELSTGFIGKEASIALVAHLKNLNKHITAEEVLNEWETIAPKFDQLGQEKWNILIDKVKNYCYKNVLSGREVYYFTKFAFALPKELFAVLWSDITAVGPDHEIMVQNYENLYSHELVDLVCECHSYERVSANCSEPLHSFEKYNPNNTAAAAPAKAEEKVKKKTRAKKAAAATATDTDAAAE